MAYAPEWDDIRQEIRRGTSATLVFWPKLDGVGNCAASATSGHCTYAVYNPSGVELQAFANFTPTTVSQIGSRFDLSVSSIANIGEDYRVDIKWRASTGDTSEKYERVYFDVVSEPWGASAVSLNSLLSICPNIQQRIAKQAEITGQTVHARASTLGHLARAELGEWIRAQVSSDVARLESRLSATRIGSVTPDSYLRPRLIKEKSRLATIEAKLAVALCYRADIRADEDEGDAVKAMFDEWYAMAKASLSSLGPLRYDIDDDGDVDDTVTDVGRFYAVRRVQ